MGQNLETAFSKAKHNKEDLVAVLDHYKTKGEHQKYKAALFLIKNLPIHESQKYEWIDKDDNIIPFSEFDYEDFSIAIEAFNTLKDSISLKPTISKQKDIEIITADFLIKNIDLAFRAWKENPWSKTYSFKTFCEYILPYRSLMEPLEPWREEYAFLVRRAKNNLEDPSNPIEVCTQLMNQLKGFSFLRGKSAIPSPFLSTQQLLFRREGSCPELANLALLSSRSIGLAVTLDYTPHYGGSSNRHYWNMIIDKNGKAIPFNGSSARDEVSAPQNYSVNNKRLAKVIRKTYSIQNKTLASKINLENIPNTYLKSRNIIDVTPEYVPIGSIKYKPQKNDTLSIAYLNVFNIMKWRIIDWAEKNKNDFKFKNLGRDIVYLPSYYSNGKTTYTQYPVLLDKNGEARVLEPDFKKTLEATLSRLNEYKNKYEENNTLQIKAGKNYHLFYWDKEWVKIGTSKATIEGVHYKNIPHNALFLLIPPVPDKYERVFILEKDTNRIIWY